MMGRGEEREQTEEESWKAERGAEGDNNMRESLRRQGGWGI